MEVHETKRLVIAEIIIQLLSREYQLQAAVQMYTMIQWYNVYSLIVRVYYYNFVADIIFYLTFTVCRLWKNKSIS